jgi:hypothetical protein
LTELENAVGGQVLRGHREGHSEPQPEEEAMSY